MKTKTITHKKIEICKLTKKPINTEKEKYAIICECEGDNIFKITFWKHQNLLDLIRGNLQKVAEMTMGRIGGMAKGMLGGLMGNQVVEVGV